MRRVAAIMSLAGLAGCPSAPQPALHRGVAWLWSQQEPDGGWHSKTYGLLRSGQAITPFVLDALLEVPGDSYTRPPGGVDRAIAFIRARTHASAPLGMSDPNIPDYPNYATALAVSAICRARRPGWASQVAPMVAYLRTQQFTEQNGWHPPDPAYGAWGMGGERRTPPFTGHVDLSMTRYVLDALRAAGASDADPALTAARTYVERCQNFGAADGGFFFSTTEADTNKAGEEGDHFRSYGTTKADGILALLATGHAASDPRVVAAKDWLVTHHRDLNVPGFTGGDAYRRWPRGLAYYYAASATRAFRALDLSAGAGIAEALRGMQRRDGSWANPENLVKEDDPLIATGFAVRALVEAGAGR